MIRYYQDLKLLPADIQEQYQRGEIKLSQRIVPRQEVISVLNENPNWISAIEEKNRHLELSGSVYRYQPIPCGHCWACKLNYSAEWATRIMYECKNSDHNYFITFTYDDVNLPLPESAEYDGIKYHNDGTWTGSLYPDDISKFLNSLRKYFERKGHTGIKYFYAGEYGETTKRPHYHMILMNCPLDINQFHDFHQDERKKLHWKSYELENYWKEGMIDIGEVEFASAAYVARYCMKKITNDSDKSIYWSQGKMPEFVRMSRRPGIGTDYFNENLEKIYKTDEILVKNFHGQTITVKPPKAWDRKFKELYPEAYEQLKESRKAAAERSAKLQKELSDMTDLQRLTMNAEKIYTKGKMLPRDLDS